MKKFDIIITTALLTLTITLGVIYTIAIALDKQTINEEPCASQLRDAQVTLHAFRVLFEEECDTNIFLDVLVETDEYEQINNYFEKYGDPYEL